MSHLLFLDLLYKYGQQSCYLSCEISWVVMSILLNMKHLNKSYDVSNL